MIPLIPIFQTARVRAVFLFQKMHCVFSILNYHYLITPSSSNTMKRRTIIYFFMFLAVTLCTHTPAYGASAASETSTSTLIAELEREVVALQAELAKLTGTTVRVFKVGLKKGDTHPDMERIQKTLARDEATYPAGLVTGYFGQLTEEALIRFQARHHLPLTGTMTAETQYLLERYYCASNSKELECAIYKNDQTKFVATRDSGAERDSARGSVGNKSSGSEVHSWGGWSFDVNDFFGSVKDAFFGIPSGLLGMFDTAKTQAEIEAVTVVDVTGTPVSAIDTDDPLGAFIDSVMAEKSAKESGVPVSDVVGTPVGKTSGDAGSGGPSGANSGAAGSDGLGVGFQ
jgi:peptidoglycan hydrolase-like protein with peptidoglycan-binding domain